MCIGSIGLGSISSQQGMKWDSYASLGTSTETDKIRMDENKRIILRMKRKRNENTKEHTK